MTNENDNRWPTMDDDMKVQNRTYFVGGVGIIVVAALVVVYFAGFASGRRNAAVGFLTIEAQQLIGMVATFTLTPAATVSPTPTATGTRLPTATPSATPTATTTPASPEEWADRFQALATTGLNAISIAEFDSSRAQALLQRIAQEQLLHFVPVSYHELAAEPWAAVAMPRTPDGKVLPMLFWREANDRNRIRSQFLLAQFSESPGAPDYSSLVAGIDKGVFRIDAQGRGHILLIERPEPNCAPARLSLQPGPARRRFCVSLAQRTRSAVVGPGQWQPSQLDRSGRGGAAGSGNSGAHARR